MGLGTPRDLASALLQSDHLFPRNTAVLDAASGETLTYTELQDAVARVAALLHALRVSPGQPVALLGNNSLDFAVTLLGVMGYGAIAMPLSPDVTERESIRVAAHSGAYVAFAEGRAFGNLSTHPLSAWRDVAPRPRETTTPDAGMGALLIYTSGTTGDPKGVLLPHDALCTNVHKAIGWFGFDSRHRTLAILPLHHTFALVSDVLPMLFCGGTAVIARTFDLRDLGRIETAIRNNGVCSFSAVPLIFEVMNRIGTDLRGERMRFCVSGAAPLPEPTRRAFLKRQGFPIIPAYGLTESCCFCSISRPEAVVPGSAGVPVVDLRVLDERDQECGPGEIGELVIRGPEVIRGGYFRDDRACYVDGWFRTGDLGLLDDAGNLFITGRKKNMVIRGGEKVYLGDIDSCLRRHESVADAVSVGLLDETPERVVSFVVVRGNTVELTELSAWLEGEVGRAKAPDEIRLIGEIPYTRTGKARIGVLQAMAGRP